MSHNSRTLSAMDKPQMDIRWKQRFVNYEKAFTMLSEIIARDDLNKFEEQGLVQCFEYTFELGWKMMKDYLFDQGVNANSPRETIQAAFHSGLISDGHMWLDALSRRNLMAHTYDENLAKQAVSLIRSDYSKF